MISVGYGVVALYLAALLASAMGVFLLGKQVHRSRSAAAFFFLWGGLASLAVVALTISLIHGFVPWPSLPYVAHFHPLEFHVHNAFPLTESPLTICHHIPYLSLQLPPHTFLLPFLAAGIPMVSFISNQTYMNRVHARLSSLRDGALSTRLTQKMAALWPGRSWEVVVVKGSKMEAFSYAVFRPRLKPWRMALDVVAVTRGLTRSLEEDELVAALAHEFAHLEVNDHRYLTFFKTLCGLVFFDPAVVFLSRRLCKEAEFKADHRAAMRTRNPLALARALLKVHLDQSGSRHSSGLPGVGFSGSFLRERIERLLRLAEEMKLRSSPPSAS